MARILIVAGGCRGRWLAGELVGEGHAVRVTTRTEAGRAAIEATGAECWIGTPERLGTLRAALESVTIVCWLLGTAVAGVRGGGDDGGDDGDEVHALNGSRLEFFLGQAIDTTVRGFVYEAAGTAPAEALAEGERIVRRITQRNEIPVAFVTADPGEPELWQGDARAAIDRLLLGR